MPIESPLRNRVKEVRERLGIKQSDLARQIGITRQTIIAIEKGRLNPSILICLKMARLLREPVDYVFYLAPGWEHEHEGANLSEVPRRGRRKKQTTAAPIMEEEAVRLEVEREAAAEVEVSDTDGRGAHPVVAADVDNEVTLGEKEPEAVVAGPGTDSPNAHTERVGEEPRSGQAIWDFF
jgi:putative transcriptional regulator